MILAKPDAEYGAVLAIAVELWRTGAKYVVVEPTPGNLIEPQCDCVVLEVRGFPHRVLAHGERYSLEGGLCNHFRLLMPFFDDVLEPALDRVVIPEPKIFGSPRDR